eukprot:1153237-Pelagomonas_calceolata.AAC.6
MDAKAAPLVGWDGHAAQEAKHSLPVHCLQGMLPSERHQSAHSSIAGCQVCDLPWAATEATLWTLAALEEADDVCCSRAWRLRQAGP